MESSKQVWRDPIKTPKRKDIHMKNWYLIGSMGGMKMMYFIGVFATEQEAREKAILRYKLKPSQVKTMQLESKEV